MNRPMMKRSWILALVGIISATAMTVGAATPGKAKGSMVVSKKSTPFKYSYVVEKDKLLKIILSDQQLDEAELTAPEGVTAAADARNITAVAVQLDEDRKAEEVYFFHPKLPAGLSVRELSTFTPTTSNDARLAGRVAFVDPGFSFSYDATFDAPILLVLRRIGSLPDNATPAQHARWRLDQLEIEFDEQHFRSHLVSGEAEVVKLFLDAGMPVETEGALTDAVGRGNVEVAKVLITAGANVNAADQYKQSLVMNAASAGRIEILRLLIAAGADVSAPNTYKITPLSAAAEQGQLEVVRLLLAAKAKVNSRDPYGGTALSVAVLRGYKDVVKALIDAGADVQRDKKDLLETAKDKPEIKAILEQALKKK